MPNYKYDSDANRKKLADTVYELREFHIEQLIEAYTAKFEGDEVMDIGQGWTIKEYLDYLVHIEVLVGSSGQYKWKKDHVI